MKNVRMEIEKGLWSVVEINKKHYWTVQSCGHGAWLLLRINRLQRRVLEDWIAEKMLSEGPG